MRFAETMGHLDDCMEKANSKGDLPPLVSENVFFKITVGNLIEGTTYVGSQAFRRFIRHLATTRTQRQADSGY